MTTKIMLCVCKLAWERESDYPETCCLVLAAFVRPIDPHLKPHQRATLAKALVRSRNPSLEAARASALVTEVVRLAEAYLPPSPYPWERPSRAESEARELLQNVSGLLASDLIFAAAQYAGQIAALCPEMVPSVFPVVLALARDRPALGQS